MNKITLMVGLSGLDKSATAEKLAKKEGAVIVSVDKAENNYCTDKFYEKIKTCLKNNDVIVDAPNITIASRKALLDSIKGIECKKVAYIISKPIEMSMLESESEAKKELYSFQMPLKEEGFDEIIIDTSKNCRQDDFVETSLNKMKGFEQFNPYHTLDLYGHCDHVRVEFVKKYKGCDLAVMLHDIGKPFTQVFEDNGSGIAHYKAHENVGAYYLLSHLDDLACPLWQAEEIIFLANYHMLPFSWHDDKTKEKWHTFFGDDKYEMLMYFNKCEISK